MKPIIWLSQKEVAKLLGVSMYTFRQEYLEKYPPERTRGKRKYWSNIRVEAIANDILGA